MLEPVPRHIVLKSAQVNTLASLVFSFFLKAINYPQTGCLCILHLDARLNLNNYHFSQMTGNFYSPYNCTAIRHLEIRITKAGNKSVQYM
jgi:hypothetical protein